MDAAGVALASNYRALELNAMKVTVEKSAVITRMPSTFPVIRLHPEQDRAWMRPFQTSSQGARPVTSLTIITITAITKIM
jgi:hypothetical protein